MTLPLCSFSLIDLLQGSGQICGMMNIMVMMVVIGMMIMKINFLIGMMDIKNGRLKKPQLKKSYYPLLGIHQGGGIGACKKTKKRERKIVDINMDLFCVW